MEGDWVKCKFCRRKAIGNYGEHNHAMCQRHRDEGHYCSCGVREWECDICSEDYTQPHNACIRCFNYYLATLGNGGYCPTCVVAVAQEMVAEDEDPVETNNK